VKLRQVIISCSRGVFHASRASVVGSLEAAGAPSSQVELVRGSLAPGRRRRKRRVGEDEWVTGDPILPAGWRIRLVYCSDGHAVTFLQTPQVASLRRQWMITGFFQGVKLKGRKAGLAHVLQHPAVFSEVTGWETVFPQDTYLYRSCLKICFSE
jgi:hypothetical protein